MAEPRHLVTPAMAGNLMICTGKVDMFWKRPLIVDGPEHHLYKKPRTTNGTYFCQMIRPHDGPLVQTLITKVLKHEACIVLVFIDAVFCRKFVGFWRASAAILVSS